MKIHTTYVSFHLVLACSYYATAQKVSESMETVIDLNLLANGARNLKPTHILLSARDWNGPPIARANTYFLKHDNVRYICTAQDASLCPHLFGEVWVQTDNKLATFANTKNLGVKLTLTKGSLEYSCFTLFPKLCPVVPGGVWVRAGIKNGGNPGKAEARDYRSRLPTVSCYSQDEQICRNMMTDDSWVIMRHRNSGEAPGVWMRKETAAELFCNAPDVRNCPFNDGGWIKVVPSNPIRTENHEDENNRQESDESASAIINKYRRQVKIHDTAERKNKREEINEAKELNITEREEITDEHERDEENRDEDEEAHESRHDDDGSSHKSDEGEIEQEDVSREDNGSNRSYESQSSVGEREESNTSESDEASWGDYSIRLHKSFHWGGGTKDPIKGYFDKKEEDQEESGSVEDEGSSAHDEDPNNSGDPDSAVDYSKAVHKTNREWSTRMGEAELLCRAHDKRLCPIIRYGKTYVKWHKVKDHSGMRLCNMW